MEYPEHYSRIDAGYNNHKIHI